MPLATDAGVGAGSPAVDRLEQAMRAVLGVGFEDGMRALVEDKPWYSPTLPVREVFRLWVFESLFSGEDPLWVFQPVRAGERKYLCDHLGIERSKIIGLSPRKVADLVLRTTGLPSSNIAGLASERSSWQLAVELAEEGEDERAAVILRQRAEGFLRRMLHFFCSVGHGGAFLELLREPGGLRLPKRLLKVLDVSGEADSVAELIDALAEEAWADLGFLALALRKLSAQLERNGSQHISGKSLVVFQQSEFDALTTLATALQPYAHHRPSMEGVRKDNLVTASKAALVAVDSMIERNVVPEEVLVFEGGASIVGASFRGILDTGTARTLVSHVAPQAGAHVVFIASTSRDYASCVWAPSPWSS